MILMLGNWWHHADYCHFVTEMLKNISKTNPHSLYEYETEISKLFILNLDKLKKIIAPLYSNIGRSSNFQPKIFRSFILMNMLIIPLDRWVLKLTHNPVLQTAIGVTQDTIPCVSSHYDFINRLIKIDEGSKIKKAKPHKKLGKNIKMPNRHPNIVARLVTKILCGRSFSCRSKRLYKLFLQELLLIHLSSKVLFLKSLTFRVMVLVLKLLHHLTV